jgi:hypothetical protein
MTRKGRPHCPKCKAEETVIPIVYGLPGERVAKATAQGKADFGGCVVTGSEPEWYCTFCGSKWK